MYAQAVLSEDRLSEGLLQGLVGPKYERVVTYKLIVCIITTCYFSYIPRVNTHRFTWDTT